MARARRCCAWTGSGWTRSRTRWDRSSASPARATSCGDDCAGCVRCASAPIGSSISSTNGVKRSAWWRSVIARLRTARIHAEPCVRPTASLERWAQRLSVGNRRVTVVQIQRVAGRIEKECLVADPAVDRVGDEAHAGGLEALSRAAPGRRTCQSQPAAMSRAPHSSAKRAGGRRVMRSVRSALGTVTRLSKLKAHSAGMPSSRPRCTCVPIARSVRVAGATSTALSTGIAAWRVRMQPGRRPLPGSSYHHISPRFIGLPGLGFDGCSDGPGGVEILIRRDAAVAVDDRGIDRGCWVVTEVALDGLPDEV